MNLQNKNKLIHKIKAEIDLDRLTELLAADYMQQIAHDLKDSIENAERG